MKTVAGITCLNLAGKTPDLRSYTKAGDHLRQNAYEAGQLHETIDPSIQQILGPDNSICLRNRRTDCVIYLSSTDENRSNFDRIMKQIVYRDYFRSN